MSFDEIFQFQCFFFFSVLLIQTLHWTCPWFVIEHSVLLAFLGHITVTHSHGLSCGHITVTWGQSLLCGHISHMMSRSFVWTHYSHMRSWSCAVTQGQGVQDEVWNQSFRLSHIPKFSSRLFGDDLHVCACEGADVCVIAEKKRSGSRGNLPVQSCWSWLLP